MLKNLSVFFPAYNEAQNIKTTVLEARKILPKQAKKWEIIVIDDGSTDSTGQIVKNLIKTDKRIKLITHTPNLGYGAAVKTGISQSKYDYICFTDSDGQYKFKEINKFISSLNKGADMVIGFRKKRTDNLYRRFMAQVPLRLAGILLFNINVKDVDCGFKLFKSKVIDTIGPLKTSSAITETELVTRTKKAGFNIVQVGVNHHSRIGGEQTGGRLSVILKAAHEGIKLWIMLIKE